MWSEAIKMILLVGLTVLCEEGQEAAHKQKQTKYSDWDAECKEAGWRAVMKLVKMGW